MIHRVMASLVLFLALALGGCAQPGSPAAPVEPEQIEELANSIYATIGGDATQREAAHYLQWTATNADFWTCMEEAGFTPPREFSPLWSGWAPDGTSNEWMGSLNQRPSTRALAIADSIWVETPGHGQQQEDEQPGYGQAANRCDPGGTSIDLDHLPGLPTTSDGLLAQFHDLVNTAEAQLGPIDPYVTCMAERGIDYRESSDGLDGWHGLYTYLTAAMPKPPRAGDEPSQKWLDYLDLETAALAADEECRADTFHRGLSILAPSLVQFQSDHAAELEKVAAEWAHTLDLAREAGFRE